MTLQWTTSELLAMREAHFSHMNETCRIAVGDGSRDEAGQVVHEWVEGDSVACGFGPAGKVDIKDTESGEPVIVDAVARLPHGTTVEAGNRFILESRWGTALSEEEVYDVVSEPRTGPSGAVVALRQVTS